MILLERLSSENNLFDPVIFKIGINIIQGVSRQHKGKDANGVGKSSIVRLIDFCLGANVTVFKNKKYSFLRKDTIILKLSVNNRSYTIKRNFNNDCFVEREGQREERFSLEELRQVLSREFFPVNHNISLPKNAFRNLIKFFIKDDISKMRQDRPYKFSPQAMGTTNLYWFNLNLYLMGIENRLYIEYDSSDKKFKDASKEIREYKKILHEKYNRRYTDLEGDLVQTEKEIKALKRALNEYKYTSFEQIEDDIISIGRELKELYILSRKIRTEISNLKESLTYDINIDLNEIKNQYQEIKAIFSEIVIKELQDIINFNKQIRENRERFLSDYLQQRQSDENNTLKKIRDLENKRADLITVNLNDTDTQFITERIQYLVTKIAEHSDIKAQLSLIKETEMRKIESEKQLSSLKENILEGTTNRVEQSNKIKEIFKNNFQLLLTSNIELAQFDIGSDIQGKILYIHFSIPREDSKGDYAYSFMIYDISLFFNLVSSSLSRPGFLFHDGIFGEGVFTDKLIGFINNIDRVLKGYQYQYIITLNEDNVREEDKARFSFDF